MILYLGLKSARFGKTGYKRHRTKVKVLGSGRNNSYLAGFSFFFYGTVKKFNQLAKKNYRTYNFSL